MGWWKEVERETTTNLGEAAQVIVETTNYDSCRKIGHDSSRTRQDYTLSETHSVAFPRQQVDDQSTPPPMAGFLLLA